MLGGAPPHLHPKMAPLRRFAALLLGLSLAFLSVSPSQAQTCTSQNFTNNKLYKNCTDLPTLSAHLHWTYNSTESSLSMAFIAPPAKSDGWIAWAINPNGTGMAGAQALIAFKGSNGSMVVNTYNISSYRSIVESKIAFNVSNKSAEHSGGVMRIFATLTLPANYTKVNHIWQVGGAVTDGFPDKHEFQPANLNAKGTLDLVTGESTNSSTIAPAPAPGGGAPTTNSTAGSGGPASPGNGVSRISRCSSSFFMLLLVASIVLCS